MSTIQASTNWHGSIAITGLGLVTPVGLVSDASIAAMRAGISQLRELPYFTIEVNKGEFAPVTGAEVPGLPAGRHGVTRLVRLLNPALVEAIDDADLDESTRVELFLGTAGDRPAQRLSSYSEPLQQALLDALPVGLKITRSNTIQTGRAAVLQAIRAAAISLEQGNADAAIVGGVDSWISPRSLCWLQAKGRLREYPRKTGMLPGEAAGFLVLETMQAARARGAEIYASFTSSAGTSESIPYGEPSNADALGDALNAVTGDINEECALVISDFNGERYRALEWASAMTRGMWYYRNLRHWHPAEFIGDTGAASGAVTLAWAATALKKSYAGTGTVLVWGASDEGAREAAVLGAVEGVA